jgi:hypothetical protein
VRPCPECVDLLLASQVHCRSSQHACLYILQPLGCTGRVRVWKQKLRVGQLQPSHTPEHNAHADNSHVCRQPVAVNCSAEDPSGSRLVTLGDDNIVHVYCRDSTGGVLLPRVHACATYDHCASYHPPTPAAAQTCACTSMHARPAALQQRACVCLLRCEKFGNRPAGVDSRAASQHSSLSLHSAIGAIARGAIARGSAAPGTRTDMHPQRASLSRALYCSVAGGSARRFPLSRAPSQPR